MQYLDDMKIFKKTISINVLLNCHFFYLANLAILLFSSAKVFTMIHLVNRKMNTYHIFTEYTPGQKFETTSENILLLMNTQNIFEKRKYKLHLHIFYSP